MTFLGSDYSYRATASGTWQYRLKMGTTNHQWGSVLWKAAEASILHVLCLKVINGKNMWRCKK